MGITPAGPTGIRMSYSASGSDEAAQKAAAAPPTQEAIERSLHFREVIDYALKRLGDGHRLAVNRDLSNLLDVSTSMVTRYRSGMDPYTVAGGVLLRLARAAGLGVDALFIWLEQGSKAAFAFERERSHLPRAFSELDLARELVAMLERNPALGLLSDRPGPDYGRLERELAQQRQANPAFERLAQALPQGAEALEAVRQREELKPAQWEALAIMLNDGESEFAARYSLSAADLPVPERSARTAGPPA